MVHLIRLTLLAFIYVRCAFSAKPYSQIFDYLAFEPRTLTWIIKWCFFTSPTGVKEARYPKLDPVGRWEDNGYLETLIEFLLV